MEEKLMISTGEVVVKELNFGDEGEATRKAIAEVLKNNKELDLVTKKEYLLLESLREAPFAINIEALRSIKRPDGLLINQAWNRLNEVVPGESASSEKASSKGSTLKERSDDSPNK